MWGEASRKAVALFVQRLLSGRSPPLGGRMLARATGRSTGDQAVSALALLGSCGGDHSRIFCLAAGEPISDSSRSGGREIRQVIAARNSGHDGLFA